MQKSLLVPLGPELVGPKLGHNDAVLGLCITDTGLVMSAGFDCALCVFDARRPHETMRKVEKAHMHSIVSVTHDPVNNWFVTGAFDGTVRVRSSLTTDSYVSGFLGP
jgi:WD40 repeat protein